MLHHFIITEQRPVAFMLCELGLYHIMQTQTQRCKII